ncbi:MAG TPA: RraA family protein [Corynebacteriales bacterium]|nr:RraA family protein [Mycobacteriales bacterium]
MARYGKVGFCFVDEIPRVPRERLAPFADFVTPNVADVLGRFIALSPRIRPISDGLRVFGQAITVKLRPADNLMAHKAVDIAQPGDVLVIDTGKNYTNAPWGELLTQSCMKKGIAGLVIDGVIRDVAAIRELKFPIFCCGFTPNGCDKDGPGEVNTVITCGGQTIRPGDIILGDDDGVICVPLELLDETVEKTRDKVLAEERRREEIAQGILVRKGIDAELRRQGIIS